jgi:hypothetical protein
MRGISAPLSSPYILSLSSSSPEIFWGSCDCPGFHVRTFGFAFRKYLPNVEVG